MNNIRDHGLDFVGCDIVFDGPVTTQEDDRLHYGEQRINLLVCLPAKSSV
ncbi:MAG TPA: BrnT family toxin [Rubrivivax sp.]|nr:BrnT family toxin [Rubrivivax sp.]